jgi:hypothetical protein
MDKSCEKNRHKTDRYYQLAKNQSQQQTKQKDVLQLCSALTVYEAINNNIIHLFFFSDC